MVSCQKLFLSQMILNFIVYINNLQMSAQATEPDFGSTSQAHASMMDLIWGPGINIAIILAIYSYRKLWGYVHGIFGLFACVYTLATSLPMLFQTGIIEQTSTQDFGEFSVVTLNYHYLIGITCLILILIQTVLGMLTKYMYFFSIKSMNLLRLKKLHQLFGYAIVILCKSNYFIILYGNSSFWVFLAQDIVFTLIIIARKYIFPRMEAKINLPSEDENDFINIESTKQLESEVQYVVFANYVFDIEPLRNYHPGGNQIIEAVKNKQVDRYIYGMLPPQQLPQVPIHSHSYKSFTLLGMPLAKICIPPTYSGFTNDEVPVKITSLRIISEKGGIYQMKLSSESGTFAFLKYKNVAQLGRYYSITLNNSTTRLYTSVNFLVKPNKIFLAKYLKGFEDLYGKQIQPLYLNKNKQMNDTQMNQNFLQNYIPILFKRYENGKFTDTLVKKPIESLILSCSKGEGLQIKHLKPGKIIIVAGGTGIYPFSDLIDLLYKSQLIRQHPQLSSEIMDLSPILRQDPFKIFTFHLMAAFNNFEDIHPITFYQIAYLASKSRIGLTLKMKDQNTIKLHQLSNVKMVKRSFEEELRKQLKEGWISKVWICGPPKMNEGISTFLKDLYKDQQIYMIL